MKKKTDITVMTAMLAVAFVLAGGLPAQGQDVTWTNADPANNYWDTDGNWDLGHPPLAQGDDATINMAGGDRAILNTPASPDSVSWWGPGGWIENLYVGTGGNTGELDIEENGGVYTRSGGAIGSGGGTGTVNQNGGVLAQAYGMGALGDGAGSQGTYNLSGGYFRVHRYPWSGIGMNGGTGLLNITGGTFENTSVLPIGSGGTFRVVGSGAEEINIGITEHDRDEDRDDGFWWQQSGTLEALIDSDGVTPIVVPDNHPLFDAGNVAFYDGALLNVGWADDPVYGTWEVMIWDGDVTDEGLAFAPGVDTNIWSFDVVDAGGGGYLTVTAIPEPSSLVLLGLAGLLLMKRRRV